MPKHKADNDFWGYLIQPNKSPTPLFQELLLGIAHYISKHMHPWEVRSLTPSKLALFYRTVGGNYDSLFLETPNASIAFIYKSLGCFHSLQPTKDPFAPPSIPALTNDGFVRWQTVQLLLGPEEHVPYLQKAVKCFEIRNPMTGEFFPEHLPADAFPKKPDPEMTRWHDQAGDKLFREFLARQSSDLEASTSTLLPEEVPITEGIWVQSPPDSGRRPNSFGQTNAIPPGMGPPNAAAASEARAHRGSNSGLHAPPAYVRRHSVPDRARGEHADPVSPRVYTPPPQRQRGPVPSRNYSQEDPALASGPPDDSYFPRPSARRHDSSSHARSGSSSSPHPRQHAPHLGARSLSHDRPHSHSRSPPRNSSSSHQQPASQQAQRRPPLSSADSGGRRHTLYNPFGAGKDYPRPSSGSSQEQRAFSNTMSPQYYAMGHPQPGSRHASLSGPSPPTVSGPQQGNILPLGMQGSSPPPQQPHMASQPPSQAAIPPHLRSHSQQVPPSAPAQSLRTDIRAAAMPPPTGGLSATSAGGRPTSSSSDMNAPPPNGSAPPSATLPGPNAPGTFSPGQGTPMTATPPLPQTANAAAGVRFAPDPSLDTSGRSGSLGAAGISPVGGATLAGGPMGSPLMVATSDRPRRRTMDELARERERERVREEREFEWGRRKYRDRDRAGVPAGGSQGRSRSGGER